MRFLVLIRRSLARAIAGARLGTDRLSTIDERPLTIAFGGLLVAAAVALAVGV